MGSISDWSTLEHAARTLEEFGIPYEKRVVSAHRTPDLLVSYATGAEARGLRCIIAGAGGAAHLPGMTAAMTVLPVLGVPVATFAIGKAGALNAALFAVALLAGEDADLRARLHAFRARQTAAVLATQQELEAPAAG
jgi:5-(carboxyamino)imidazole ribonucleotide mutase